MNSINRNISGWGRCLTVALICISGAPRPWGVAILQTAKLHKPPSKKSDVMRQRWLGTAYFKLADKKAMTTLKMLLSKQNIDCGFYQSRGAVVMLVEKKHQMLAARIIKKQKQHDSSLKNVFVVVTSPQ